MVCDRRPNPLLSASTRLPSSIVHAIAHRKPFVTITPLARIAPIVNALAPRRRHACSASSRVLPPPLNDETVRREGEESHSAIAPSILTTLDRMAKRRNNE